MLREYLLNNAIHSFRADGIPFDRAAWDWYIKKGKHMTLKNIKYVNGRLEFIIDPNHYGLTGLSLMVFKSCSIKNIQLYPDTLYPENIYVHLEIDPEKHRLAVPSIMQNVAKAMGEYYGVPVIIRMMPDEKKKTTQICAPEARELSQKVWQANFEMDKEALSRGIKEAASQGRLVFKTWNEPSPLIWNWLVDKGYQIGHTLDDGGDKQWLITW